MKNLLQQFLTGVFFSRNLTSENLQALYTICLNVEVIQRDITEAAMFCFVFFFSRRTTVCSKKP